MVRKIQEQAKEAHTEDETVVRSEQNGNSWKMGIKTAIKHKRRDE